MSRKLDQLKEILGEVSGSGSRRQRIGLGPECERASRWWRSGGDKLATLGKIAQENPRRTRSADYSMTSRRNLIGAEFDDAAMIRVAPRNYEKTRRRACRVRG